LVTTRPSKPRAFAQVILHKIRRCLHALPINHKNEAKTSPKDCVC
jgi:hypothetical protein